MIVCLATLETSDYLLDYMQDEEIDYGLTSFYFLEPKKQFPKILSKIRKGILIDSGAFSFQRGEKVDIDSFCNKYIEFIKENTNNPKIMGFFELDVDNIYGYDKILQLRRKLETVSDKIIPVWHNNRGIDNFIEMCKEYSGRRIAITGFANNDIKDSQYNLFINTAHKYGCTIHILGLTRFELIQSLNLGLEDSVDSSSWKQTAIFGGIFLPTNEGKNLKIKSLEQFRYDYKTFIYLNYLSAKKIQEIYLNIDNSVFAKTTQK